MNCAFRVYSGCPSHDECLGKFLPYSFRSHKVSCYCVRHFKIRFVASTFVLIRGHNSKEFSSLSLRAILKYGHALCPLSLRANTTRWLQTVFNFSVHGAVNDSSKSATVAVVPTSSFQTRTPFRTVTRATEREQRFSLELAPVGCASATRNALKNPKQNAWRNNSPCPGSPPGFRILSPLSFDA